MEQRYEMLASFLQQVGEGNETVVYCTHGKSLVIIIAKNIIYNFVSLSFLEVIIFVVLLLGIFIRAPCPSETRGCPCALLLPLKLKKKKFIVNLRYQLHQGATGSVLNVLKLMGKYFIDPKSSEILSIFQVENNLLNHFIHFQLQNNAPYALKLHLK
jgi:hypothetical protein